MNKAEVYEHLANIYLDSSRKRKKIVKSKASRQFKILFVIIIFIVLVFLTALFINSPKKTSLNAEIAYVIQPDVVKINYNFNVIKKEVYSMDLNSLELSPFKTLAFSVRKTNPEDTVFLRVELTNAFKEISEVYLKDIKYRWKSFRIALADFKNISEWSDMSKLSFIVEEWNTKNKHGVVYIDDVKFIK